MDYSDKDWEYLEDLKHNYQSYLKKRLLPIKGWEIKPQSFFPIYEDKKLIIVFEFEIEIDEAAIIFYQKDIQVTKKLHFRLSHLERMVNLLVNKNYDKLMSMAAIIWP